VCNMVRKTGKVHKLRDSLSCDVGKWMQLGQDRVQWLPLVLAVLNCCVLLPES
jgi:hypothetical protein